MTNENDGEFGLPKEHRPSMENVIELKPGPAAPKPRFTLVDLEAKLSAVYDMVRTNQHTEPDSESLTKARSIIHELLAEVVRAKTNSDAIEMPLEPAEANARANQLIDLKKPEFTVAGVQLIENKKLVGVSLYSNMVKARGIKDVLNAKFAELRVDHEAKILVYPVY